MSGLAPIIDPNTGAAVAVFGIDVSARQWDAGVARFRIIGFAAAAFFAAVVALFWLMVYRQVRNGATLALANRIAEDSATFLFRLGPGPNPALTFASKNISQLGYEPKELLASRTHYRSLVHPDDWERVSAALQQVFAGSSPEMSQIRIRSKQGDYRWVQSRARPIMDSAGLVTGVEGSLTDITKSKELEERLQFTNTLLTTEMETSADGILVVDKDGAIISHNRHFAEMWGIPVEKIQAGEDAPLLAHVTDAVKDSEAFLARVRYLYAHQDEEGHDELQTRDGRFIERNTAGLRSSSGQYLGRVWFFRDVSNYRRAEAEIRHTAGHDTLTGLANRRIFLEAVQQAIERTDRGDQAFAVLFLDLDHFKDVNDTLGRPAGDELLRAVADRLRDNTRGADMASRFGGDEFALIATSMNEPADAADLAQKLVKALAVPFRIGNNTIRSAASIGIVICGPGETDAETLMSHADEALYKAKADGRGGYRFYTDSMDIEVRARVTISAELRDAIAGNQLFLEYQPQIEIETGRIIGLEALARWHHPMRGDLGPNEFIQVAEKSGLINDLGRWVIREACRQEKIWLDAGIAPPLIAVNVSALQFKMALDFEKDVTAILAESGLPPHRFEIELTESAIMEASREHGDVLARLRGTGVRLAIDDFGTGYSSLDYLRRFPADRLKIAQEFVRVITVDPGSVAIVKATMGLARELGMAAIAEGVETREQLALLKTWGCREVQGFYYAKPLSPADLLPLLRSGRIEETPAIVTRREKSAVG